MTGAESNVQSGLYIDVENLRSDAKELIIASLKTWPSSVPFPTKIVLYVPADMVELWRIWADANISEHTVELHGIQHFTAHQSKNSADIAIAVEAMSDLLKSRVHHISVFSDDSDFISLFAKVRIETKDVQSETGKIPFLWILTNRDGTKSPNIKEFFPDEYLHIVDSKHESVPAPKKQKELGQTESEKVSMVKSIIEKIPVGPFKSTACKEIIDEQFPNHPMAQQTNVAFGSMFKSDIWPLLQQYGVSLIKTNSPRTYEMTQAAKDLIQNVATETPG